MKKIGVCVRYDCNNYGSMLQILATQVALEKCGYEYEFIRYNKKTFSFVIKNLPRLLNPYYMRGVKMAITKKKAFRKYPKVASNNSIRLGRFKEYREKHFHNYSNVFRGYSNLVKGAQNYDTVLVGSDQLWTPAGIASKFYNLLFVPNNINKVSYATSFGVSYIPDNQIEMTTQYLARINHISVREKRGSEIVKELTGREVPVTLDPTLLLTREEWNRIIPYKEVIEGKYIFCYYLGTNSEHRNIANKLKELTGLKIVTIPHLDEFVEADLNFGDEQLYNVGPEDFLNIIRDAQYICTDSFHGSIFSILNHKQFFTFDRFKTGEKQSRNSRIDSLFELLGLEARRCSSTATKLKEKLDQVIDYDTVQFKLGKLREESFRFLDNALNK